MTMTIAKLFYILALIAFVLATISVSFGSLALVPLGLVFMAAGHIAS